jgi:cysteine synthase
VNPEARHTKLNLTRSIKEAWLSTFSQEQNPPRHIIAEATGGNSGIPFAAIGRVLGHPVKIFIVGLGWSTNLELPNEPLWLRPSAWRAE